MRFIQYANQDFWWKWPEGGMKVFNINGGWHKIDGDDNPPPTCDYTQTETTTATGVTSWNVSMSKLGKSETP